MPAGRHKRTSSVPQKSISRRVWVRRSGYPATSVFVKPDQLVDDLKSLILLKYPTSLCRQCDPADLVLELISTDEDKRNSHSSVDEDAESESLHPSSLAPPQLAPPPLPSKDSFFSVELQPYENVFTILDNYFPDGMSMNDALLVSPSVATLQQSHISDSFRNSHPQQHMPVSHHEALSASPDQLMSQEMTATMPSIQAQVPLNLHMQVDTPSEAPAQFSLQDSIIPGGASLLSNNNTNTNLGATSAGGGANGPLSEGMSNHPDVSMSEALANSSFHDEDQFEVEIPMGPTGHRNSSSSHQSSTVTRTRRSNSNVNGVLLLPGQFKLPGSAEQDHKREPKRHDEHEQTHDHEHEHEHEPDHDHDRDHDRDHDHDHVNGEHYNEDGESSSPPKESHEGSPSSESEEHTSNTPESGNDSTDDKRQEALANNSDSNNSQKPEENTQQLSRAASNAGGDGGGSSAGNISVKQLGTRVIKKLGQIKFPVLDGVVPKIHVLIVEDNVINQKILEAFMRRKRIRCGVARNGKEAVEKWRQGGYHLVLMDLQLPVMSGLDATKEIRRLESINQIGKFSTDEDDGEEVPELKPEDSLDRKLFKAPVIIVALTASSSSSDKQQALSVGCNDFLTKPVNLIWLEQKTIEWGCMQALIDFDGWKQWIGREDSYTGSANGHSKTPVIQQPQQQQQQGSNSTNGKATSRWLRRGRSQNRSDKGSPSTSLSRARSQSGKAPIQPLTSPTSEDVNLRGRQLLKEAFS